MANETRIGAVGLPDEESRKLPYLLKWLRVGELGPFRFAEDHEAPDFLLVDADRGTTQDASGASQAGDGPRVIWVAEDPATLSDVDTGMTYPLRVDDLQRCLYGTPSPSETPSARAPGSGQTSTNPEPGPLAKKVEELVEPLLASKPGADLRLELDGNTEIVASPANGYFASNLSPRELAKKAAGLDGARWTSAPDSLPRDPKEWQPLQRLIWLLAYYGARDGLLPRMPRDKVFSLEAWPDYQVIPMEANNLKVWAFLKWNAANAGAISEGSGVEQGQVLGSLNAGFLCGQVRLTESAGKTQGSRGAASDTGILGRIRERLGLGSASAEGGAPCPK